RARPVLLIAGRLICVPRWMQPRIVPTQQVRRQHRFGGDAMADAAPMTVIRKLEAFPGAQVERDEAIIEIDGLVAEAARLLEERLPHQIEVAAAAGLGGSRIAKAVDGEHNGLRR